MHSYDANLVEGATQNAGCLSTTRIFSLAIPERLYVGITNNLVKRLYEHRSATTGFVLRYKVTRLVYFEVHQHPINAISREKQIKGWLRSK